jgi:glycosyltransferase involved in cell wall biosynthesis
MKPRVFISIATSILGGPGKGLIQFLRFGGLDQSQPVVSNFLVGEKKTWQFRDEIEKLPVPFIPLRQNMTYDPFLILRGYRVLKENDIQILQSHGYKSNMLCAILKLITGLPHIAFMHGWTAESWKIRVYQLIDLFLYRFADRVVIVSESLRPKLTRALIPGKRIVCIKNAVEAPHDTPCGAATEVREEFGIPADAPLLCVIGRFSPEKGQLHFIEALRLLVDSHPLAVGVLVGDGQDRTQLEQRVRELELSDRVVFAGYRRDMAPFYRACDVVVMPSLSEGMPNVALEAMAFGKPLVGSRVGGMAEVVVDGETGTLVAAANPPELAAAIRALLDDPGKLVAYGLAGEKRVAREFSPALRAQQILGLYQELLHPAR